MEDIKISVCIITKNEADCLKECLERLKKYNFEIVVVDTGSSDNTLDIAKQYTDKVSTFEWCDDFSKARNFSIEQAAGDYILVLDTDEFLDEDFDMKDICKLIEKNPADVGRIKRINPYVRDGKDYRFVEYINRFFKKGDYHYEGRIHEQISLINQGEYSAYNMPITIVHGGYNADEAVLAAKADRNIALLEKELVENGADPYILYQLGKSYYMKNNYERACDYFSKGLEFDLDTHLEYVIDMVESYGYSLVNSKRYEEALSYEGIYKEFSNSADFVFLMGIVYMNNAMFKKAVEEFEKSAKMPFAKIEGVNGALAYYNIGVIYECLGRMEEAVVFYKKSGDYKPARKRLEELSS